MKLTTVTGLFRSPNVSDRQRNAGFENARVARVANRNFNDTLSQIGRSLGTNRTDSAVVPARAIANINRSDYAITR